MYVILSARRINDAALVRMFLLLNIRVRLTYVALLIDSVINSRKDDMITARLVSAYSREDETIRVAGSSM